MKVLLSVVLAIPLGCLALLTFLALLGVLALAGALREGSRRYQGEHGQNWTDFNTTAVKSIVLNRSIIKASPCSRP